MLGRWHVIRELSIKELYERIDAEIFSLNQNRINYSISPLDNPSAIKEQRRSITRLNTELRQRELNHNEV